MDNSKKEKLLDYVPGNKNAERVRTFLKETMVYSLNENAAFVAYNDCYIEPYNETPIAALPLVLPNMDGMLKLEKKLLYSEIVSKQKVINEWEKVSRQITGTISNMLSDKVHEKVKKVYPCWNEAIVNGKVVLMIKMIRNGLISDHEKVREIDKIKIKQDILNFTRLENEHIGTCNDRLQDLLERAESLDVSPGKKKELSLIYIHAQKKYFAMYFKILN